jgi:dihydrofolate reductase
MKLSAVVAASDNDVIGRDNAMPWHLPADLAYFKRVTMGKPMLMGRKTYESIGRPLPGRRNLVLSRRGFSAPGVESVATIDEALARVADAPELMVIGGAEVFRLAMPYLDHVHLTRVHTQVDGDILLPPFEAGQWREVRREDHPADERNPIAMTFLELERVRG